MASMSRNLLEAIKVVALITVILSLALKHNFVTTSQPARIHYIALSILVNLPIQIYGLLLECSVVSFHTALHIDPLDLYLLLVSSKLCCSPYITSTLKTLGMDLHHNK